MKATDYVVRSDAADVQRGSVSAENHVWEVPTVSGQEISFNLRQTDIRSFSRKGNDLEIRNWSSR